MSLTENEIPAFLESYVSKCSRTSQEVLAVLLGRAKRSGLKSTSKLSNAQFLDLVKLAFSEVRELMARAGIKKLADLPLVEKFVPVLKIATVFVLEQESPVRPHHENKHIGQRRKTAAITESNETAILTKSQRNGKSYQIIVDSSDVSLLKAHNWGVTEFAYRTYYASTLVDGHRLYLHRLLTGAESIWHIDGNTLNNRRENLEVVSWTELHKRRRKNHSSAFTG